MTTTTPSPEHAQLPDDFDLTALATEMRAGVEIADRKYRLRTYKACFVGSEACDWLVESGHAVDYPQALLIGNLLQDAGAFHHVVKDHEFKNEYLFYRFTDDEDHGKHGRKRDGSIVSWSDFMKHGFDYSSEGSESFQPDLPDHLEGALSRDAEHSVEPLDDHNAELLDQVHPRAWVNPEPAERYNMVVIGAGTGGLVTAAAVAGLGGKVALIEKHLMGGDCLNFGCVPSKALLRSAKAAAAVREAAAFGVRVEGVEDLASAVRVDFGAVMERLRRLRAEISHHDSAERFSRDLGVDVFIGSATFTGKDTVQVGDTTLRFAKATIATGGSPTIPPIPGLADAPYLTNMSVFNLTELPPRMAVIGAGVIGVELAQAFARFGSKVTLFEQGDRILPREDADAAGVVHAALERDGVTFRFGADIQRVSHTDSTVTLHTVAGDFTSEALLVATGRKPNVSSLGLEAAGVEFDPRAGVTVNDRLQTSNSDIFAVGDVATRYQFTHTADFMARLVVRNALFFGRDRFSNLLIPWSTYTQPELAHVGLYPRDLDARGIQYKTFTKPFKDVDRAKLDGATEGFVRIHIKAGTDQILGATIVGEHAGDLISEITVAMQSGTGLGALASIIHPYPTLAEAIRHTGDLYNRTRLTLTVKKIFRGLLRFKR